MARVNFTVCGIHDAIEDPVRSCMVSTQIECWLPWLAAMRLQQSNWKGALLWRRTDDAHSTCTLDSVECAAEVFWAGTMYWGSALTKPVQNAFQ